EQAGFGFWDKWLEFIHGTGMGKGFISATDQSLYHVFHTPAEALDHIDFFYKNYHSMRFMKERVVLRLKQPLGAAAPTKLHKEVGFLPTNGKIVTTTPLPEEANEPELKELPRLTFPFDRRDYGSLRRLIDFINSNS